MVSISIGDAIVGEKDGFAEFLITLDASAKRKVTFHINTYAGSAGYSDFTERDIDVSIAKGATQVLVRIPITDDSLKERNESFHVALQDVVGATVARNVGTATIIDNDAASGTPVARIEDRVVDEAAGTVTFAVTLDRPSSGTVKIDYATADGTALAGSDYTAVGGTLTFRPGETAKLITVALTNDGAAEGAETFTVALTGLRGAVAYDPVGDATIGASDARRSALPNLSVGDATIGEKDGYVDFVVTLDAPSKSAVTVSYNNYSGSAGYSDFEEFDGFLTFAAGETTKTVRVAVIDDSSREALETFHLALGGAEGATIARAIGTAYVVDNDAPSGTPIVTVQNVVVDEKAGEAVVTIVLDRPSTGIVSFDFATRDGTAGAGSDYAARSGSLRFGPGETVRTLHIPIGDDARTEAFERFDVVVSNVRGASVLDDTGSVTIGASDGRAVNLPTLTIDDAVAGEKDGYVDVVVRLDAPTSETVTVRYNNYSGLAGYSDFQETDGFLTFAPGETTRTIRILVNDDSSRERTETFFVGLDDAENASIAKAVGTVLVFDNDAPSGTPYVTVRDIVIDEKAGEAVFTVALDRPSTGVVSLDYATLGGTATAGADYGMAAGSLSFAAGETVKTIRVAITDDGASEGDERFSLGLTNVRNATALDPDATALIAANDQTASLRPYITIGDATAGEADGFLQFVVRLSAPSSEAIEVSYNNYSGSAGYSDFAENDGFLTFAPGETVKVITVPVIDDTSREARETFWVGLDDAVNAQIADYYGAGAIIDNDAASGTPIVSVRDVAVDESAREATFVVTLDRPSSAAVTMDYATAKGTATAGQDFVSATGSLAFAPGETAKTVTVLISDDNRAEGDETVRLVLSHLAAVTAGDIDAVATIGANDAARVSQPTITISGATTDESGQYVDLLVRLSAPTDQAVTIDYNSYSGTASYADFQEDDGTLVFTPGETLQVVRVGIVDDTNAESAEMFFVGLRAADGGIIGGEPATVTIADNDSSKMHPLAYAFGHAAEFAVDYSPFHSLWQALAPGNTALV